MRWLRFNIVGAMEAIIQLLNLPASDWCIFIGGSSVGAALVAALGQPQGLPLRR